MISKDEVYEEPVASNDHIITFIWSCNLKSFQPFKNCGSQKNGRIGTWALFNIPNWCNYWDRLTTGPLFLFRTPAPGALGNGVVYSNISNISFRCTSQEKCSAGCILAGHKGLSGHVPHLELPFHKIVCPPNRERPGFQANLLEGKAVISDTACKTALREIYCIPNCTYTIRLLRSIDPSSSYWTDNTDCWTSNIGIAFSVRFNLNLMNEWDDRLIVLV